jgi:Domain of unknown function (DUF4419)
MLDYIQSFFDKVRKRDNSLRLGDPPGDTTAVMQSNARRKTDAVLAEIVPSRPGSTGITFSVDKVERSEKVLPLLTLLENLEIRGGTSVLVLPEQASRAVAPHGFLMRKSDLDHQRFLNPLIEAVHLAFSDHRPLVLTPDCIWLTIVQGFGHHIHRHAEALRGRIVKHEGKKSLCVETHSLGPAAWPRLISQFSAQIRDNSDPVLYETLLCDFSTTTPDMKVAKEVALMDAYQRYFKYIAMCVCGIPTITLEGNPSDWQRIRDRIDVLATFGLEWWTSRLAPILDEFVATANGAPDLSFWQAIYKPQRVYAAELATGWIADLFPYIEQIGDASERMPNPMLGMKRTNWLPPASVDKWSGPGIRPDSIPCGLSKAPLRLNFPNRPPVELNLVGGFVGVSQCEEDLSLAPIISWGIVEKNERISEVIED